MTYGNVTLHAAHSHSSNNRDELQRSALCGCFYCVATFSAVEVEEWVDDGRTALCPKCGIDSVIGTPSEYPVEPAFLSAMHKLYF